MGAKSDAADPDRSLPEVKDAEHEAVPETEAADGRAVRAERRRAERREAILAAAKRVFRGKGYHQASVHDIIDDACIARGTFYLYFSSKQEVLAQLVDDFLRVTRAQVKRISLANDADPPLLQLRANFRRVVTTVREHDDVASIILRDPISFDEESRARVNLFFDQVLGMIEDALDVGRGLGLVGTCDTHIVAVTALGGLRAALNRMLAASAGDPREHAFSDPERVADELMAFFLRGMSGGDVTVP